ncbi:MAG: indolepyruvate oxidoreductase subunit beta [Deferribacterota bacterium]|nr:indolepyruvate oxidoreductase subunit beta [Deferribacterota bacterium]
MKTNILMTGVGGQGIILASDILAEVALLSGFDVKKSEIHGMSQRGGSVISHIRIGDKIFSPVISENSADIIISFEEMEFLRYLEYANPDTVLIVNKQRIYPITITTGNLDYPSNLIDKYKAIFHTIYEFNALELASEVGNPKVTNIILLGTLSNLLPFSNDNWLDAIKNKVKNRFIDINIKAFEKGQTIVKNYQQSL